LFPIFLFFSFRFFSKTFCLFERHSICLEFQSTSALWNWNDGKTILSSNQTFFNSNKLDFWIISVCIPLNVITVIHCQTDYINLMITISKSTTRMQSSIKSDLWLWKFQPINQLITLPVKRLPLYLRTTNLEKFLSDKFFS
jgi:hypothetical protein